MTPLGLLNFLVLQWFGFRLARVYRVFRAFRSDDMVGPMLLVMKWIAPEDVPEHREPIGWTTVRWVWPLTGWWSDYRWIARRS